MYDVFTKNAEGVETLQLSNVGYPFAAAKMRKVLEDSTDIKEVIFRVTI